VTTPTIPAIQHGIDVRASADHAFTVFTARMATWWPLHLHSIGAGMDDRTAVGCAIEPRLGGRIYEVLDDGTELDWGRVVAWEPGRRVALDWNPSTEPRPYTRVEVRFTPTGSGTCRVDLTHSGWEAIDRAAEVRGSYDSGWPRTLALLAAAAAGAPAP
jgi:uncharacterized protein YndB with AHSA1/START domain